MLVLFDVAVSQVKVEDSRSAEEYGNSVFADHQVWSLNGSEYSNSVTDYVYGWINFKKQWLSVSLYPAKAYLVWPS